MSEVTLEEVVVTMVVTREGAAPEAEALTASLTDEIVATLAAHFAIPQTEFSLHAINSVLPPRPPPSPPSAPRANANGDPHLLFVGGRRADFRGIPGRVFAFVSAPGFAANVRIENASFAFANATIHGTYMTEVTMRCGDVRMAHNATNATQWGFGWTATRVACDAAAPVRYVHPHASTTCHDPAHPAPVRVWVEYATATFECGAYTLRSTVQPVARHVGGASRNLDLCLVGPARGVHGILGQNLDARTARDGALDVYPAHGVYTTTAQAEGAIDGSVEDYLVASAYATAFRYGRFDATSPTPTANGSASDDGPDVAGVVALD